MGKEGRESFNCLAEYNYDEKWNAAFEYSYNEELSAIEYGDFCIVMNDLLSIIEDNSKNIRNKLNLRGFIKNMTTHLKAGLGNDIDNSSSL